MAPPTAPAAGRLPLQHAARPARPRPGPGGQVPRSPGPQEPPGGDRSVPPAPCADVSVSTGEGRGGELRKRSFLQPPPPPAGMAAPSLCAPQRSATARAGALPSARTRRLPPCGDSDERPLSEGPRDPSRGGRWSHLVWGGSGMRGASVPLSTPWGLPVTPISRVSGVWTCCQR